MIASARQVNDIYSICEIRQLLKDNSVMSLYSGDTWNAYLDVILTINNIC